MADKSDIFDVVICGGGLVGLTLAKALASAPKPLRVALVERDAVNASEPQRVDSRTTAITAAGKALFEALGVWPLIAADAQPMSKIELTDGPLESPIRTPILSFDESDAPKGGPTAYVVENALLREALMQSLRHHAIGWFSPDRIVSFVAGNANVEMSLGSGQHLRAALLVAADGARSALRDMAGIRAQVWPSAKTGIAVTLSAERPHGGIARQHFLPAGPVALLPMTRNRISLIWTEGAKTAAALLAEPEEKLTAEIMQRAGPDLGALALLNKPASYPLTMTLARDYVRPRFALIGDAAHALHWIAGQGLNHGLKDVAALAETLCDASSLGLDLGSLSVLQRYERWRRFDSVTSAVTASALNGLFSNDSAVLRFVRSSGMSAVERVGPLKTLLMREAAGLSGTPPKLMRGEHL